MECDFPVLTMTLEFTTDKGRIRAVVTIVSHSHSPQFWVDICQVPTERFAVQLVS